MKILILFAHPRLENSRANRQLLGALPKTANITFHDLYENYPQFDIDVNREKELLKAHDIIIWQHPFYWYSAPAILKQWIDLVLEFGWAYGPGGEALKGKYIFNVITTGGNRAAYCEQGYNQCTINQFLFPFRQTAELCHMKYLPPFVVHGTHRLGDDEMQEIGKHYGRFLKQIEQEVPFRELENFEYINDYLNQVTT